MQRDFDLFPIVDLLGGLLALALLLNHTRIHVQVN